MTLGCSNVSAQQIEDFTFWVPIIIAFLSAIGSAILAYRNSRRLDEFKMGHQKQIHVHKERFDMELSIYRKIWSNVFKLENEIHSLYDTIKTQIDAGPNLNMAGAHMSDINQISNTILLEIENERPFYDKTVYLELEKLKEFIKKYNVTNMLKWNGISQSDFFYNESMPKPELSRIVHKISESIRKRICEVENI